MILNSGQWPIPLQFPALSNRPGDSAPWTKLQPATAMAWPKAIGWQGGRASLLPIPACNPMGVFNSGEVITSPRPNIHSRKCLAGWGQGPVISAAARFLSYIKYQKEKAQQMPSWWERGQGPGSSTSQDNPVLYLRDTLFPLSPAFTRTENLTLTGPGLLVTGERSAAFCSLSASITWINLDKKLISCRIFLEARSDI